MGKWGNRELGSGRKGRWKKKEETQLEGWEEGDVGGRG